MVDLESEKSYSTVMLESKYNCMALEFTNREVWHVGYKISMKIF